MKAFIFECSTATYLDCVQKGLFGSNLPWPLQIKTGDHCCLYHYEVGTLFALWQATSDGGKNLVRDQVTQLIAARFKGHALARLVESILKAQGYTTYRSPEGADGGVHAAERGSGRE